jgi:hypothetical protein
MRSMVVLAVVLAGLYAVLVGNVTPVVSAESESIAWETDLAVARAKANETGRPLMVVFH